MERLERWPDDGETKVVCAECASETGASCEAKVSIYEKLDEIQYLFSGFWGFLKRRRLLILLWKGTLPLSHRSRRDGLGAGAGSSRINRSSGDRGR